MNKLNYQGLVINTSCKYFYIHSGDTFSLREDQTKSVYEVIFPEGSTSDMVSNMLGVERLGENMTLKSMSRPDRFKEVSLTLNGIKFIKTTYDQHILKVILVRDSDSRVIQGYTHTTLIISDKDYKNKDFIQFLLTSDGLKYLIPEIKKNCIVSWELRNFPKVILKDKSLNLESKSEVIYSLREKYDNYRIRAIDYQNQFVEEMRKRLDEYGIELVRFNRERTLTTTSYCTYKFSQTPTKMNRPMYPDRYNKLLNHRLPVEFELRCDNAQLFFDFKNRYNNVDFITNFCEMSVMDKYGDLWVSAIKWGRVSDDFSHTYDTDGNSNFSYQCQFSCEIYFYEMFDSIGELIDEINLEITNDNV